jgi:hypothetical protein
MKKNMIWFVRVWLSSLELWPNIWQRCYFYYLGQLTMLLLFSSLILINCYLKYLPKTPKKKMLFEQDDPKVHAVVEKLLDVLNTPSEAVQRAVSMCLSPLMQSKQVCHKGDCR